MSVSLVSVVITTFNREEMLARAIDSVARQTYKNIEIIVSDDCSQYDIKKLVDSKIKESGLRIELRINEKNSGACYTRNQGVKAAAGEFIAGLDDDDEFTEDRIKTLIENYNDKYSFVTGNTIVKSKSGEHSLFTTIKNTTVSLNDVLWGNCIGTQILVKRDRLLELGGFDENLSSAQDADMWLRLINKFGPALRLKEPLYLLHTEHDLPRISTGEKKMAGFNQYFKKHENNMSNSQKKYFLGKIQYWAGNKKDKLWPLKVVDVNVFLFLIKKALKIL